jgi:hypothetical protein
MPKKLIALMLVICVGLSAFIFQAKFLSDRKGPEIIFDESVDLVYEDDMSETELLNGVTAMDDEDGDVSDTLMIESVYRVDDTSAIAVYIAKDSHKNMTTVKRMIAAKAPEEQESQDEEESSNEAGYSEDPEESDDEEDSEEDKVWSYGGEEAETSDSEDEDAADTEDSLDDEAFRKEQEAAADAMPSTSPRIYLSDYVVHISVGSSITLLDYVDNIVDDADNTYDLWRRINIVGEVNTAVPGTYDCTFAVMDSQGNFSNNAVLRVIVE